ncbi:MAG TPA: CARDB domain-containing protein [Vicinamibacteria bacterium]|nr:CARDB domain-containing protein [Vicinamibacteria bacterium]
MSRGALVMSVAILGAAVPGPGALAAPPPVSIEAVTVEPQSPAPGALCRLSVKLKNAGSQTATNFRFQVKTGGQEQSVYKVEVYAVNVEAGTSGKVDLHTFWVPPAARGSYAVEVTLTEAQWAQVKREGQTTTTTPAGAIDGLPVSSTQTVTLASVK